MLPEIRLSSRPVVADYLSADALPRQKLQDFEMGGVAIGDPTQGLRVQPWELRVLGNDVRLRPYPDGSYTTFFTEADIREIGFSFDQNMNPVFAYKAGEVWKLRWYDPVPEVEAYVSTPMIGARDVRICLDDKRPLRRDFSDVMVFYLKDDPATQPQRLYMRAQRDRYGVEYTVGNLPLGTNALDAVGMSKNLRIRVSLFGLYAQGAADRRPVPEYPPWVDGADGLILDFRSADSEYLPSAGYAVMEFGFALYKPPASDVI